MQLCGSARFQGSSHDFVPCSQPTALFVFLSVGSLHVTEFASPSSGNESLCARARLGTFYLLCTTVGCSLLFVDFHVHCISTFTDAFSCPELALRRAKASSDSIRYVEK